MKNTNYIHLLNMQTFGVWAPF